MIATDTQLAELDNYDALRTSYKPSAYAAVIARIRESGESEVLLDEEFPGVKPAHVKHMFRKILKSEGATDLAVGITEELGVFVKVL